jgi:hypothetical protein
MYESIPPELAFALCFILTGIFLLLVLKDWVVKRRAQVRYNKMTRILNGQIPSTEIEYLQADMELTVLTMNNPTYSSPIGQKLDVNL